MFAGKLGMEMGGSIIAGTARNFSCGVGNQAKFQPMNRKIIQAPLADIAVMKNPLSPGMLIDRTLYISGQIGQNSKGEMATGIEAQTTQTLENMGRILRAAGADYRNVVMLRVMLTDLKNFAPMNSIYIKYFKQPYPCRATYYLTILPRDALVEFEAMAMLGEFVDS